MAAFSFLLTRSQRRRRRELLQFIEVTALFLEAGFDLAYGWPEAFRAGGGEILRAVPELALRPKESLTAALQRLACEYPAAAHRLWFATLAELYVSGAALREAVRAMAAALRSEQERDLAEHLRTLPTKLNVTLLLFYLPAAFLLLLAPLLVELEGALP